jgi:hypothetical protein
MRRIKFLSTILAGLVISTSLAVAGDLVEGSDARAEPMKKALAALVKEIGAGDIKKAEALYAGEKTDVELLKAYVDGVAGAKAMRAAIAAKFDDNPDHPPAGLDTAVDRMGVHDFNSVIFLDDPDRASSSANSPLGVGIEFKRVDGTWKVLSLVSAPEKGEDHLARLKAYISTVKSITEKVKSGGYKNSDEAIGAADDAESQLPMPTK